MSNSYNYLDPDYTYTDPKTGILRNLADITEPASTDVLQSRILNLSGLASGIYIVVIETSNGLQKVKIVKE